MQTSHDTRSAGATGDARDVKLREAGTFAGELINRRRARIGMAITPKVTPPEIIREDEDDVWLRLGRCALMREQAKQAKKPYRQQFHFCRHS